MKYKEFTQIARFIAELDKIAKSIQALDEIDCNHGLSERQNKRRDALLSRAKFIASNHNLKIFHQTDPRGCTLYLGDLNMDNSNYNHYEPLGIKRV